MRHRLKKRNKKQVTVRARFIRYGTSGDGASLLFNDIVDAGTGEELCNHAWLLSNASWGNIKLEHGATVQFRATVSRYRKCRQDLVGTDYEKYDYTLSKVNRIKVIEGQEV